MNNQILSASQLLRRKDTVTHKQDLLNALLNTGDAIPLDNSGHFMIVRKQYFDNLLQTIKEGKEVKQDLEQRCHLLTLSCATSNKKLELTTAQLQRFKLNEATFQQHFQTMRKKLRQAELVIIELNQQLRIQQIQAKNITSSTNKQYATKNVPTRTASCQTDYQPMERQLPQPHLEVRKMSEQKIQDEQNKLYQMLRQQLQQYTAKFQEKMQELEKCEFELESWQKQKQQLRQENQELRKKVKTVEVEQVKTKIWSDNIAQLRHKIQQKIARQEPEQQTQKKGDGWQEAALLRGKLAEFRMQLRKVDQQMQIDQDIGDEGAVVNLVKLTQRIKSIVRALLVQASLPE